MIISKEIRDRVFDQYGRYYEPLTGVSALKITDDVLSADKPVEQVKIIERYSGSLKGKKVLEVGSGFGIFVTYLHGLGIQAYGVEPDSEGFGESYRISLDILKDNKVSDTYIKNGFGESIPFGDSEFDVVYSTNVLEHVNSPTDFIKESIRVCKPNGVVQIVVPNYGSFYDGHYSSFYIPYQPKWLWKLYIKIFHKKDTHYVDTLRTEINYFSICRILKPYINKKEIEVITFGEEIFRERMNGINFSTWAGLEKVKRWIGLVNKLKLLKLATYVLYKTKSFSPLIITIRKKA